MTIQQEIQKKWKTRSTTSHKGDFGRIFVLAGSEGMTGAAHLAAMAALRGGAGLVTLGVPRKVYDVLARREAEIMVKPFASTGAGTLAYRALKPILKFLSSQDILAIGPGLSQHPETQKLVRHILNKTSLPTVIDADGLNALVRCVGCLERSALRSIFTPHPGEFKRLFGGSLSSDYQQREKRAYQVAKQFGMVMLLKGHHTIVSQKGQKSYRNKSGNPGMATGGSGDVLTGLIAALLGQGFSRWDAARFGAYLHGVAGDKAAKSKGEVSVVAGDLLGCLPSVIKSIRRK